MSVAAAELVGDVARVGQRPCQSIELGDNELVAGAARRERLFNAGTLAGRAAEAVST